MSALTLPCPSQTGKLLFWNCSTSHVHLPDPQILWRQVRQRRTQMPCVALFPHLSPWHSPKGNVRNPTSSSVCLRVQRDLAQTQSKTWPIHRSNVIKNHPWKWSLMLYCCLCCWNTSINRYLMLVASAFQQNLNVDKDANMVPISICACLRHPWGGHWAGHHPASVCILAGG